MSSVSYHSVLKRSDGQGINGHSIASDEYPIAVNCTGNFATIFPFTTDNPSGRNDYYLLYMVRGKMRVTVGGRNAAAVSGSIFLIPPHTHYTYTYSGGEPLDYLWAHFTGSYAERLLSDCGLYPLPYFGTAEDGGRISGKFKRMFELFERRSPLLERRASVCMQDIILEAAECIVRRAEKIPLETSLRYIHSAYDRKLSVPELAAMENLSNSRYIALFNRYMGMPPTAYITELRMRNACELLTSTDMSVKQVGILVGYPDAHFFSKLFKKHVGTSPNEYRNKN
ncbi:MAG: helix-turn-helix transcriptional regulator [Clostridia bacterium]|nr:helix-turn-helix transcriptional regulator [Clostridia bacterium]